jgi:hypothetical protein
MLSLRRIDDPTLYGRCAGGGPEVESKRHGALSINGEGVEIERGPLRWRCRRQVFDWSQGASQKESW